MKKAKLMLTAITVVAVVSGALAFKAKTFQFANVYCGTTTDVCSIPADKVAFQYVGTSGTVSNPCTTGQAYYYDGATCNPEENSATIFQTSAD